MAPATSLGWPPAGAELLPLVLGLAVSDDDMDADEEDEAALLELALEPAALVVLPPLAEGEDLLEEQPAARRAATARVAPVRASDVRRDITEDHAPGEYSRHLGT
ncbi:hypothetical protein GCM10009838_40200 [Catenulispora subtropica]|uniref:Secreted protein n=1 Tax=Catenulispora subtropica TaxID=450798 RepID=A0ABN2RVZ5_9ACTN